MKQISSGLETYSLGRCCTTAAPIGTTNSLVRAPFLGIFEMALVTSAFSRHERRRKGES